MTRARVLVAGVLALMVLAGAGAVGWGLGRATAPEPPVVVAAGPAAQPEPDLPPLPVALASPAPAGAAAAAPAPVVLSAAPDLPDAPSTAVGYRLTRAGVDPERLAGRLAVAFGIPGDDRRSNDQVVVGEDPQLTVHLDPLLSWEFVDSGASAAAPVGRLPTRGQAVDLASTLLGQLGVDVSAVDWQVERVTQGVRATGWQLVAGQRSTLAWTVTIGRSGAVVAATGFAAGLQAVPGYQVVGAAFAVRRSGIAPWTAVPPVLVSQPTQEPPAATAGAPTAGAPAAGAPTAGAAVPGERLAVATRPVLVTGASLGLAQYGQPDGSVLVLPSYRLTGADGSVWSLLAVSGDSVSFGPDPSGPAS